MRRLPCDYETAFWTELIKLGALTVLAPTHAARGFVLQPFLTAENDLPPHNRTH
jgi:hypothetical protein